MNYIFISQIIWSAFVVFWVISSFTKKTDQAKHKSAAFYFYTCLFVISALLAFTHRIDIPFLNRKFLSDTNLVHALGLFLTVTGLSFSIWSRVYLGGNWSGEIAIKKQHTLIMTGPYSIVRHPIYLGIIVAFIGTAFIFDLVRTFLAIGFLSTGFIFKLIEEEKILTAHFGARYRAYCTRVKALIPGIL